MDTKSFLELVTASSGNYVLTIQKPTPTDPKGIFWNLSFDNIDDCVDAIQTHDASPRTVFFAVGTHINNTELDTASGRLKVRRTQATASMFKALCFDLDIGLDKGPYEDRRAGGKAVEIARLALGLPEPLIVQSGRGLHYYWPLQTSITAGDWTALSMALAAAMHTQGVVLDAGKIHDASMVLRPVGAHHKKDPQNWKPVKVLQPAPAYPVDQLRSLLQQWYGQLPAKKLAPLNQVGATHQGSAILGFDSIVSGEKQFAPVIFEHLAEGCAQVKALLETGGATAAGNVPVSEPIWRGSLGLAKYAEFPHVAIVAIAGGHPDYDYDENVKKMEAWKATGPTTCAYFEQHNPTGCVGCPNKGKISSPAALTRGESVIPPPTPEDDPLELPWPYLHKEGKIYREFKNVRKAKDEDGKTIEQTFTDTELVCPYIIIPVSRYSDVEHTTSTCVVQVKYPVGGWKQFEIPLACLAAGGQELARLFGNQQILISSNDVLSRTRTYLMTYLQELQAKIATSYMYDHYGWQADNTFLCGTKLVGVNDGRDFKLTGMAQDRARAMEPVGNLEKWVDATSIYAHPKAHLHQFFFLAGIGGFLMEGASTASVLLNMYSPGTGVGKTTTLIGVMSAWGDPTSLMLNPNDTDNSIYKTFGTLKNLSPCIDELTTMDAERMKKMIFQISQGRERIRMNQDASLQEAVGWKTCVLSSSNKDIYAEQDMQLGTEAQKVRVFQGYFPDNPLFAKHGARVAQIFSSNYGHVMPLLAQRTIDDGGVKAVYDKHYASFEGDYLFAFDGSERFIRSAFVCADAVGRMLTELGLIKFDYEYGILTALEELKRIRKSVFESSVDAFDIVGQYLMEYGNSIVEYRENKDNPNAKGMVRLPIPDTVVARIEVAHTSSKPIVGGRLCVNKPTFKKWLSKHGGDYTKLVNDLITAGCVVVDGERVSMYRGCDKANPGQVYCLTIDLRHPRLMQVLSDPRIPYLTTSPLAILQGGKV